MTMGNSAGRSSGHPTSVAAKRRAFPSERTYQEPPRDELEPAFPKMFNATEWIVASAATGIWVAGIALALMVDGLLPMIVSQNIILIVLVSGYMWRKNVRYTHLRSAARRIGRPAKAHRRM